MKTGVNCLDTTSYLAQLSLAIPLDVCTGQAARRPGRVAKLAGY